MNGHQVIESRFNAGMEQDHFETANGQVTYAENAVIESYLGNGIIYQNENGNHLCTAVKEGYHVIGLKNLIEQGKTMLFLCDDKGNSEIGQVTHASCSYSTLVNAQCLSFDRAYPIKKVVVKSTNCDMQLYWTDGYNPVRYINLDNLPYSKNDQGTQVLDCNRLKLQPDFAVPRVTVTAQQPGGSLLAGVYQFCVQYANGRGEGYSSYHGITGPAAVIGETTGAASNQSIRIKIDNLDATGLYSHFNLAVVYSSAGATTIHLVETLSITATSYDYTYSGNGGRTALSIDDIFQQFPYYPVAKDLTVADNTLFLANLTSIKRRNYQAIWSKVVLQWETWRIPYSSRDGYHKAENTARLKGYFRDEIYAFIGAFVLANGQTTDFFHIPGRMAVPTDMTEVENADADTSPQDSCTERQVAKYWQVYNTAQITGYSRAYLELTQTGGCTDCTEAHNHKLKCYTGAYQYGTMAYWESSLRYPADPKMWGELAGQPIRHHKFPSSSLCPLMDNALTDPATYPHVVFPMGVRVEAGSLYAAINASGLPEEEKKQIVGFKIARVNRAFNSSIIAKGLFFNVGAYERDEKTFYFPNYPYNCLAPDVYLSSQPVHHHSGGNASPLNGFDPRSQSRYTFHSPDCSFVRPFGINTGTVNMEAVMYGKALGQYVPVKENARYKFMTRQGLYTALAAGLASTVSLDTGGGFMGVAPSAKIDASPVPAVFSATLELIKNIAPWENYGYMYNSVGYYSSSAPVDNNGSRQRLIKTGSYLNPGNIAVDGEIVNNYQRESSVYLKLHGDLPFAHLNAQGNIPADNSRVLPSRDKPDDILETSICSYYGAIKREVPDQYGQINSGESVSTGYCQQLYPDGREVAEFPTVFGGDVFINRFALKRKLPFFLSHTVGASDGSPISQDQLGNVAFPAYYYSTGTVDPHFSFSEVEGEVDNIVNVSAGNIILNVLSGGIRPVASGLIIMSKLLRAYIGSLGISNTNLYDYSGDSLTEKGKAFLFCYGIPYFFVESTVNVQARHATDAKEGNYYPAVAAGDVPHDWLQEINTSIIHDNTYNYDQSYSKQIKESYQSHLPPDFNPDKDCFNHYPNRIIYSMRENMEEQKNNWLVFPPASLFDAPKAFGKLTGIEGLEDRKVLVRFESKSLLYNVASTISTTTGQAYLGDPGYFTGPALSFALGDTGYNGSQHSLFVRTPIGQLTIDALRGQVFLIGPQGLEEISGYGMRNFFANNLPFTISRYFPNADIDNSFMGIGLTAVYDNRFRRFIITKKDYEPLNAGIRYDGKTFTLQGKKVSLDDPMLFRDRSFTVSYHTGIKRWISFHSYWPGYYIAFPDGFQSGWHTGIFDHRQPAGFGNFYGSQQPYLLEYSLGPLPGDGELLLSGVNSFTRVRKYDGANFLQAADEVFFDQAVIYNDAQCSGILKLHPRPAGNLAAVRKFPVFLPDSKQILFNKKNGIFSFNCFWDIVADSSKPFYSKAGEGLPAKLWLTDNLDYGTGSYRKKPFRAKKHTVQLSFQQADHYQLATSFNFSETLKST